MYNAPVQLDQLVESQAGKAAMANDILAALSSSALFGIKASVSTGLSLTLYGGNIDVAGTPTPIANQTVTLTQSVTNYVYASAAGVVAVSTTMPTGWPGPITSPAGVIALYELDVGVTGIEDGTNYLLCTGEPGGPGDPGPEGPPQAGMEAMRFRMYQCHGAGSNNLTAYGFDALNFVSITNVARSMGTSLLREKIPYLGMVISASANQAGQIFNARPLFYFGDAADRGGFTVSFRFCLENSATSTTFGCFFGLMASTATIGNVEPDTLVSMVGIGSKKGESNLSFFHNDASGTATKTLLVSDDVSAVNFPARATDNVYELTLHSDPFTSVVELTLLDIATGKVASEIINSNLPTNLTYLTPMMWCANGTAGGAVAFGLMQIVAQSRY